MRDVLIGYSSLSIGKDWVKKASGSAPLKVIRNSADCRFSELDEVGALQTVATRRASVAEMVKAFMVDT